jgi:hypothetical protein
VTLRWQWAFIGIEDILRCEVLSVNRQCVAAKPALPDRENSNAVRSPARISCDSEPTWHTAPNGHCLFQDELGLINRLRHERNQPNS